jgi:UDP-glucose:(heptosyl)LPS alpha-1,3-glucosyltransferase
MKERLEKSLERNSTGRASGVAMPDSYPQPRNGQDLVIVQLSREGYGVSSFGTVAAKLGCAWDAAGVPNVFITPEPGSSSSSPEDTRTIVPWLRHIPVRGLNRLRYLGRLIAVPVYAMASHRAARRHKAAVVVSHGETICGDVLVVHLLNRGYLEAKRGAGEWQWRLNPANLLISWMDRRMITQRRYRRIVALSNRVAEEIERYHNYPRDRIAVIPNGVDMERFSHNPVAREEIRARHGIAPHERILLFVGCPFQPKGLTFAIDALSRLDPDTRLLVLGADDPEPFKKQWGGDPDRLLFLGFSREVEKYYSAADLLVVPSYYESCTMVGLEALAAGLPLVAVRVGGIEEYLSDGLNGFLVDRDGAHIAAKCRTILSDQALLSRMREHAVRTAAAYSWDRVAARYVEVLKDVWLEKNSVSQRQELIPERRHLSQKSAM